MANSQFISPGGLSNTGTTLVGPTGTGLAVDTVALDAANQDVILARDAANVLAQRNGTAAQELRVYNTFTSATNYEALRLYFSANIAYVTPSSAGAGTGRQLTIGTIGASAINFITSGNSVWQMNAAAGHLVATTDNVVDIGTNSGNRPRNLYLGSKIAHYNSIATAGWGVAAIQAAGLVTAVANATSASITTYTMGAADGAFDVSANCNVTVSTTHSFSLDVAYTDETNVARVLTLPVAQLAGAFVASGLITNVTGAGPYESAVCHIRCKASTTITIRTSTGGTYTAVTYNAQGIIAQKS